MAPLCPPAAISSCPYAASAHLRIQLLRSSRRTFSSSTARRKNGVLPIFQPTSLEPLSTLLNTIRNKIFIPSHLKPAQLSLIYRSKNHALLRTDPVHVTLGPDGASEEILLEPIDRTKDVPNSWKAVREALGLMASGDGGKDWANLVPLLEGMRTAGRSWRHWQWSYVAQKAGEAGAAHVLVEAARMPEKTGLYLFDPRVVREMLWACRVKASREEWSAAVTAKALGYAEQIVKLLEDKRQGERAIKAVNKGQMVEVVNPGGLPDVVGVVVELAARRMQVLKDDQAAEEEVTKAEEFLLAYMARLVPLLPKIKDLSGGNILDVPPAAAAEYELLRWVPLMDGLHLAQSLLGDGMPERELVNRSLSQLEKNITEAKDTIQEHVGGDEGGKRRGFKWAQEMVSA